MSNSRSNGENFWFSSLLWTVKGSCHHAPATSLHEDCSSPWRCSLPASATPARVGKVIQRTSEWAAADALSCPFRGNFFRRKRPRVHGKGGERVTRTERLSLFWVFILLSGLCPEAGLAVCHPPSALFPLHHNLPNSLAWVC